jgi:hypothetical protein
MKLVPEETMDLFIYQGRVKGNSRRSWKYNFEAGTGTKTSNP